MPHLTQDTIWKSDKNTRKHCTQKSQEVSPFPAGDHKATRNRQVIITDIKKDPQMRYHIGTVGKQLLEDLNMFDGAYLTLISDEDQ